MGYYVKFLPHRKTGPKWKVQFISFKKEDTIQSLAKKPKREWDIPKPRWQALGFNTFMTLEEARARGKQLNAQHHLKRQEEQLKKITEVQADRQRRYDAVLPSEFADEFEKRFVRKRDSQTEQGLRKNTRASTTWRAAQRLIIAINTDPSEWFYHTDRFYDYFHQRKMSLRYLQGVLRMANLWGFFFCRKLARPFLPIPAPRGYERQRLIEANYEKTNGIGRASRAITPDDLNNVCGKLNRKNYNWIKISIWLGLRPKEIDNLKENRFWKVEAIRHGNRILPVLWVYQTKIICLPPEDRWKPIPILFKEQLSALKIVRGGSFQRPLGKTMRMHFGRGVTLYAGRKGFTDLMLANRQTLEDISVWMGHSTLQRTWRSYKQRRKFHLIGR